MEQRISTSQLNKTLGEAMIKSPPRFPKNKICKMYYASQVSGNPPRFVLFINSMDKTNFAYTKWVENVIRRAFGFVGVPIVIEFKEKDDKHAWNDKSHKSNSPKNVETHQHASNENNNMSDDDEDEESYIEEYTGEDDDE